MTLAQWEWHWRSENDIGAVRMTLTHCEWHWRSENDIGTPNNYEDHIAHRQIWRPAWNRTPNSAVDLMWLDTLWFVDIVGNFGLPYCFLLQSLLPFTQSYPRRHSAVLSWHLFVRPRTSCVQNSYPIWTWMLLPLRRTEIRVEKYAATIYVVEEHTGAKQYLSDVSSFC